LRFVNPIHDRVQNNAMKFRFAELLAVSGRLLAERRASGGRCTQQRMKVI